MLFPLFLYNPQKMGVLLKLLELDIACRSVGEQPLQRQRQQMTAETLPGSAGRALDSGNTELLKGLASRV